MAKRIDLKSSCMKTQCLARPMTTPRSMTTSVRSPWALAVSWTVIGATTQTCDTVDEMIDWMDTTGKDYGEERISNKQPR